MNQQTVLTIVLAALTGVFIGVAVTYCYMIRKVMEDAQRRHYELLTKLVNIKASVVSCTLAVDTLHSKVIGNPPDWETLDKAGTENK